MDEEQRKWLNQYYSNFGGKEFLRLGCAITVWIGIAIALSIVLNPRIFDMLFIFMFLATYFGFKWKPAYLLFRKIIGNENLPVEPMPRSTTRIHGEPRAWWSYLPSIWWILIDLLLLLAVLDWLSK